VNAALIGGEPMAQPPLNRFMHPQVVAGLKFFARALIRTLSAPNLQQSHRVPQTRAVFFIASSNLFSCSFQSQQKLLKSTVK